MPVWEEQQLGNYSHGYPSHMPFKAPMRAAAHSALYLCVDSGGDQLVGRADNGAATTVLIPATCPVSAISVSQSKARQTYKLTLEESPFPLCLSMQ